MKGYYWHIILLIAFISAGALSSCSIKEDRRECPCWITVNIPEKSSNNFNTGILRLRGNASEDAVDYEYDESDIITFSHSAQSNEYTAPRGSVGISAVAIGGKTHNIDIQERIIAIPVGCQMDSLYGYFKTFHTRTESVVCNVDLSKQFCTVNLAITTGGDKLLHEIEILGNISGLSAYDLLPVEGRFQYVPAFNDERYSFRIPRQIDNSLVAIMKDGEEVVETFPIGTYIENSGYDWTSKGLADIDISIDIPAQQVKISVSGWDGVFVMEATI